MKPNSEIINGRTKYSFKYLNDEMIWYNFKSTKILKNVGHCYLKTPNKLYIIGGKNKAMYSFKLKVSDSPEIFFNEPTIDL
jgi:hypothetical protein